MNNPSKLFEGNFTIFNNEIWDIAEKFNLSHGAIVLYMKMKTMAYGHKNTIFPSQLFLSKALHCSIRTIQRYIRELVQAGCLKSIQRDTTSNLYVLLSIKKDHLSIKKEKLSTGTTHMTHKEELLNTKYVCEKIRDDDKTLEIIKVLGDNFIDIDSPRGQEYFKIVKQEKATPTQLDYALKKVTEKIIKGKIRKSEFGFVVMSIRQSKAGLVVLYPTKKQNIQKKKNLESIKENKDRKEYYEKFIL